MLAFLVVDDLEVVVGGICPTRIGPMAALAMVQPVLVRQPSVPSRDREPGHQLL